MVLKELGTQLANWNAKQLLNDNGLVRRHASTTAPIADSTRTDLESGRQLLDASSGLNSTANRFHNAHGAPQVHSLASHLLHRHECRSGAPFGSMDLLISETDYRQAVGRRLRRLIEATGMSQVAAAGLMGITKNHLGNWLRGAAYPQPYALYRFCKSAGVNTDYVLLGDPSGLPKRVADAVLKIELGQDTAQGESHQNT
jgi:transcriptional regulator with XRE-family HTH domain